MITAYENGANELSDSELLDRAYQLKRILSTQDDDLLTEAAYRIQKSIPFFGVIYAHQMRVSIGICVQALELIGKAGEPEDLVNRVQFLPL